MYIINCCTVHCMDLIYVYISSRTLISFLTIALRLSFCIIYCSSIRFSYIVRLYSACTTVYIVLTILKSIRLGYIVLAQKFILY